MQLIDMQDYSPAARRYWWTVVFLGVWALVYAISKVGQFEGEVLLQVLAGALVAAIAALFPGRAPGAQTAIPGASLLHFLVLVVSGAPAALLAATPATRVTTSRRST